MIVFDAVGLPAPKGSSRAMIRGGAAVNVPSGSEPNRQNLASWKSQVVEACQGFTRTPLALDGALVCAIVFRMPARKGDIDKTTGELKPTAPFPTSSKPDVDKLLRATFDAITTSAVIWTDDARVAAAPPARVYAPLGTPIGATIIIGQWPELRDVVARWLDTIATLERAAEWVRALPKPRRARA